MVPAAPFVVSMQAKSTGLSFAVRVNVTVGPGDDRPASR